MTMERWLPQVDAVLMAWYPGLEGGNAIADVLTGAVEPTGRLPITWPRDAGQCPCPYDDIPAGRRGFIMDLELGPQQGSRAYPFPRFPFGFGLGYTTIELSAPTVLTPYLRAGEDPRLSITATNTGPRVGETVIQVYLGPPAGGTVRPRWSLVAFCRVALQPGESRLVALRVAAGELAWRDQEMTPRIFKGTYEFRIGSDSTNGEIITLDVVDGAPHHPLTGHFPISETSSESQVLDS